MWTGQDCGLQMLTHVHDQRGPPSPVCMPLREHGAVDLSRSATATLHSVWATAAGALTSPHFITHPGQSLPGL